MLDEPTIETSWNDLFSTAKRLPVYEFVGFRVHTSFCSPIGDQVRGSEVLVESFDMNSGEDFALVGDSDLGCGKRPLPPLPPP